MPESVIYLVYHCIIWTFEKGRHGQYGHPAHHPDHAAAAPPESRRPLTWRRSWAYQYAHSTVTWRCWMRWASRLFRARSLMVFLWCGLPSATACPIPPRRQSPYRWAPALLKNCGGACTALPLKERSPSWTRCLTSSGGSGLGQAGAGGYRGASGRFQPSDSRFWRS